jgi:hypothetical protein
MSDQVSPRSRGVTRREWLGPDFVHSVRPRELKADDLTGALDRGGIANFLALVSDPKHSLRSLWMTRRRMATTKRQLCRPALRGQRGKRLEQNPHQISRHPPFGVHIVARFVRLGFPTAKPVAVSPPRAVRVVTIIDALWVEISDGECPRPVGGRWNYRWPLLGAVGVVAGSSVGATPPSAKLLRD